MSDTSDTEAPNGDFSDIDADILHAVMALVSDGIWDWNANTGFVYRNPGWYEMLGYAHDSLENTVFTWESVIHPDDYPYVMKVFDDYINRRTSHAKPNTAAARRTGATHGSKTVATWSRAIPTARSGGWSAPTAVSMSANARWNNLSGVTSPLRRW